MISPASFWYDHRTSICLTLAYIYSLVASAQPPLSKTAGYFKTWAYKIFKTSAANLPKRSTEIEP